MPFDRLRQPGMVQASSAAIRSSTCIGRPVPVTLGKTVGSDDDVIRPDEFVTAGYPFGGAQLIMVWVLVLIMRHGVVEAAAAPGR